MHPPKVPRPMCNHQYLQARLALLQGNRPLDQTLHLQGEIDRLNNYGSEGDNVIQLQLIKDKLQCQLLTWTKLPAKA